MRRTKHTNDSQLFFDWLEIAAQDLLAARLLLEQEQCLEIAGFHCQQCMEKALKAYLITETGVLVDGHNLTWLFRQAAKQHPDFTRWLNMSASLNRLYIETRYPSDRELVLTTAQAQEIYDLAADLYDFICDEIYEDADGDEDDA